MAHKCSYVSRFYIEDNDVVLSTTATYKNNSLDIYKEYIFGKKAYLRNTNFSYLAGYLIDFPGETVNYYGHKYKMPLENWYEVQTIPALRGKIEQPLDRIKEMILEVRPDLKYFCKKYKGEELSNIGFIINFYLEYPESETLIDLGLIRLATNKSLYKLKKAKIKEILSVIRENKEFIEVVAAKIMLKDFQNYILHYKDKMTFTDYIKWYIIANERMSKWARYTDYEVYKYINNQCNKNPKDQITISEYNDYIDMCKEVGHDVSDQYWKYPNNFRKMHDRVMEQVKEMSIAKLALQQEFLTYVCKDLIKFNKKINGYDVFIPIEARDWKLTCDELYQCLIRNGYLKKVINQECIIVFIWKDGKPQATAELDYNKKLLQFYGDERGHSEGKSCLPSEEVQQVFEEWLKTFKPKKVKFNQNEHVHYYKGFTAKKDESTFFTNVGSMDGLNQGSTFKVGEVYETPFEDEEIYSKGGKGCVATNKVFHFCNAISEISKHYSPNYYCEIEPLGAVVEHNGALLSNRIKIVRFIPEEEVKRIKQQEELLCQN